MRVLLLCAAAALAPAARAADPSPPSTATALSAPASPPRAADAEPKRSKELGKDPSGCTWVQSEATVSVGEQDTRHQTRAAAINEARSAAMEDFLGVNVTSRFLDYRQEGLRDQRGLTESLLQTTRNGRVLRETVVKENYADAADCSGCRFHVLLKSCLMPLPDNYDKDFRVELELNRERFVEGDLARLKVTPTKDSYLYIYDVGMNWETTLIVPYEKVAEAEGQVQVQAGRTWEYPPPANKRVSLEAQLPDAKAKISAETIRVIAARTPLSRGVFEPSSDGYLGVLQRLYDSKAQWSEDVKAFTIYKH